MKRVRMVLAYDGTNYCGWQLQPNGITIEEVLNQALSELLREPVAIPASTQKEQWRCLIRRTGCRQTRSVLL